MIGVCCVLVTAVIIIQFSHRSGIARRLSRLQQQCTNSYCYTGEYKRVNGKGYSFVIPAEWVGDTFVELAKAQRAAGSLDYGMRRGGGGSSTLPDSGTYFARLP